ncbi:TPA: hypothetical protein KEV35_003559 [Escherichia coli]|nr:hypothetical protein [Escherichia coli]
MCDNHYSGTAVTVIKTLMDALIDISVIANMAHKHATSETEYAGAFVPHSLAVMQISADQALETVSKMFMDDVQEVRP